LVLLIYLHLFLTLIVCTYLYFVFQMEFLRLREVLSWEGKIFACLNNLN